MLRKKIMSQVRASLCPLVMGVTTLLLGSDFIKQEMERDVALYTKLHDVRIETRYMEESV